MMRLYNDDCLNVLKTLKTESIDCVVTDCPYHIISGGCTNDAVKIGKYPSGKADLGGIFSKERIDDLTIEDAERREFTRQGKLFKHNDIEFSEWMPEIYRVLKQDTHCYIMINPRNVKELQQVAEDAGFQFQQLIVWDKGNATPNRWYLNGYELILMLRKGMARNINNLGTINILRVPNIIKTKMHPTEKPADLMKILVDNSTFVGDTVLDPFMGVGGTGVAAVSLGRDFIGIEIDENFYNIADHRINKALNMYSPHDNVIDGFEQLSLF